MKEIKIGNTIGIITFAFNGVNEGRKARTLRKGNGEWKS
jgi:hypothetical protein